MYFRVFTHAQLLLKTASRLNIAYFPQPAVAGGGLLRGPLDLGALLFFGTFPW